jgi:hypothetical protein
MTDAEIDRIADAVPIDTIDVHITTWHRRFARAVLAAQPLHEQLREMGEAHAAQPAPAEPVALESVHLTRDTSGMCTVRINGRTAIRDNGDIIDHMATLGWFAAAQPAPVPVPVPVPLTDEQIRPLYSATLNQSMKEPADTSMVFQFARAIERAHGIAASPEVPNA